MIQQKPEFRKSDTSVHTAQEYEHVQQKQIKLAAQRTAKIRSDSKLSSCTASIVREHNSPVSQHVQSIRVSSGFWKDWSRPAAQTF